MNPRDFLDLANELAVGDGEAEWRSAVSRAYYAAFHQARLLLVRCGFAVPRAETAHAYLWLRLSNSGHADLSVAGQRLQYLRGDRNAADYDIDSPFAQTHVTASITRADTIVRLFEDALAMPHVLAQITAAMRDYERTVLKHVTWHA